MEQNHVTINMEMLETIKDKLTISIEDKLKLAGISYRIFSRVKSENSLREKLSRPDKKDETKLKYRLGAEEKLLQDVIGIRVILYYVEDIAICRDLILPKAYQIQEEGWQEYKTDAVEFRSQKTNGVFDIPQSYITKDEWSELCGNLPIDRTFEVQLRTVFFEGWHEIEHEIVYKELSVHHTDFWNNNKKIWRKLSSVLATLELCDWTIEDVAQAAAEKCKKSGNWDLALKSYFRLAFSNDRLNETTCTYLSEHPKVMEQVFAVSKKEMVSILLNDHKRKKLSTNRILFLLVFFHKIEDAGLIDCLEDEIPPGEGKIHFEKYKLAPMKSDYAFHQSLELPGNKMEECASLIYLWVREHMQGLPFDLPEHLPTERIQCKELIGHHLDFHYEPLHERLHMELWHISASEAGVIWHVIANAKQQQGRLHMVVKNICEHINPKHCKISRPTFVEEIIRKIGVIDADVLCRTERDCYLQKEALQRKEVDFRELIELLNHKERHLPVLVLLPVDEYINRIQEQKVKEHIHNNFEGYSTEYIRLHRYLSGYCHVVQLRKDSMEALKEAISTQELKISAMMDSYGNILEEPMDETNLCGGVLYWNDADAQATLFPVNKILETRFEEKLFEVKDTELEYDLSFRKLLVQFVKLGLISEKSVLPTSYEQAQ